LIRQLAKLRDKSIAELADRSRQHVSQRLERFGLSSATRPLDAREILRAFSNGSRQASDDLVERFNSTRPPLFRSFETTADTVRLLSERFPHHASDVVEKADRIIQGRFDLLGYQNLFFRANPPDWHFDPVSGKTSPRIHWSRIPETDASETGDKKVIWELSRHQYFSVLGQAYQITGDEKYSQTFVEHVRDWCEENPPKLGVNWLSSLEVAFRSISWIWAMHFFGKSQALTEPDLIKMLSMMHLNGRHLESYLSTYFSPNTHLTGEALGLYYLGSFLPEFPDAERWKDLGYRILIDSLDVHVRPDGVYCEQSSHYHRYTTDFYLHLLALRRAQKEAIEPKHLEKLDLLLEQLVHITQPNGESPMFGDEDGGRSLTLDFTPLNDFRPTLALGVTLLGRGDLKFVAAGPSPELLWLLGPEGLEQFDSLESVPPVETIKEASHGGIYCARTAWTDDADHIVIDCGPHGFLNGGHAHADALSFILSVKGRPLFIDSGTYVYTADLKARDLFRSTAAHNCLTIDGVSSSVSSGPFSWKTIATSTLLDFERRNGGVFVAGEHDGFSDLGVDYKREIEFTRDGTTIIDNISSERFRSFEINFILAPGLSAEILGRSVVIREGEHHRASIETTIESRNEGYSAEWKNDDWQISTAYGRLTPTRRLRVVFNGTGAFAVRNTIRNTASVG